MHKPEYFVFPDFITPEPLLSSKRSRLVSYYLHMILYFLHLKYILYPRKLIKGILVTMLDSINSDSFS